MCYEGIHEKIDYLKDELHVDAVCIGPMNPTPNFNYGYNIIDYNRICAHHYGSMEDFEKLRVALHKKGIFLLFLFLNLLFIATLLNVFYQQLANYRDCMSK